MNERHHYEGNKKLEETDSAISNNLKERAHFDTQQPAIIPTTDQAHELQKKREAAPLGGYQRRKVDGPKDSAKDIFNYD